MALNHNLWLGFTNGHNTVERTAAIVKSKNLFMERNLYRTETSSALAER